MLSLFFQNEGEYFKLKDGFKVYINYMCNGFIGMVLWVLILLIFKVKNLIFYVVGIIYLFFLNILRILIILKFATS
jgi:hypothetical protein